MTNCKIPKLYGFPVELHERLSSLFTRMEGAIKKTQQQLKKPTSNNNKKNPITIKTTYMKLDSLKLTITSTETLTAQQRVKRNETLQYHLSARHDPSFTGNKSALINRYIKRKRYYTSSPQCDHN